MRRRLPVLAAGLSAAVAGTLGAPTPAAAAGPSSPAPTNLVVNGSFEKPAVADPCKRRGTTNGTPGICFYAAGGTGIRHWTVGGDDVEVFGAAYAVAAQGGQALDLAGTAPGSVQQAVRTTKGRTYTLSWYGAGNTDCGQKVKTMAVSWDGTLVGDYAFDATGHTHRSLGWVRESHTVTASGATSTVRFADVTADRSGCGALLDAVSVAAG